ncbi:MAG: site-specific DNA-methyltransferase [Ignavibacteriales bacterium]|nr:site-specific DNA-methyltransferase [Ignavibacteriales bacterium]
MPSPRATKNKTITLSEDQIEKYSKKLIDLEEPVSVDKILDKTINRNLFDIMKYLPDQFVDLLILDPPYNLDREFGSSKFRKLPVEEYSAYLRSWLPQMLRLLKPEATIYICGDYISSISIFAVANEYFKLRNRITWQRDKGRGASKNWKNSMEDIWFFTMGNDYTFNLDAVKEKKSVIAPYKEDGQVKDWKETEEGRFRMTHPSNIWTDITIPYWSMSENTDHPTQKPEKLLAKLILASSNEGDVVFDPFLGSGTSSVVAKKLNRHYVGIEIDNTFAATTEYRLELAENDSGIQGYVDGVFWERNSLKYQKKSKKKQDDVEEEEGGFFNFM